jgi:lactoylglutathione lyase
VAIGKHELGMAAGGRIAKMYKRIDHIALHVADLERSVAFYELHFGFKNYSQQVVPGGVRIAYLKLGDTVLELTHRSEGAMNGFHFCLETDAFDSAVSGLQAAGVAMVRAPHATAPREPREENWRRVVFRGPDGEQIELRG